jgi:signal transduction histidine kinase
MWVGTNGDGLFLLEKDATSVFTTRNGLTSNAIRVLCEDRRGAIWIGTLSGGLCRYERGSFTSYSTDRGLAGMHVLDVVEDSDGSLWVATRNGLNRFKSGRFFTYRAKDGLGATFIYRIIIDQRDHFWFSCANGIFRVEKDQLNNYAEGKIRALTVSLYGTKDGMRTTACTAGIFPAGWRRKDGTIVFATYKGMTMVDPRSLSVNRVTPTVYVEKALINGRDVQIGPSVEAAPGIGRLEVHYTGLSYLAPEKVRFKFMLEGFDGDWIFPGTRRTAYYTNLNPGRYRFRVIACNEDGQWNEAGASFSFRLKPHFYQTYWFYASVGLVLALFAFSLHRLRVRRVVARHGEVLDERLRMSREIHDTLGQGFAAISAQLEIVSERIGASPAEALNHLELAKKYSAECFQEARWLIRSLRDLSLNKTNLADTLRKSLREFTEGTDCQTEFRVFGSPIPLLEEVESNLLRIGQEAINNAINHGRPKHIWVDIEFEPRSVTLRVTDDGCGFNPSQLRQKDGSHLGLIGISERASRIRGTASINSAPGAGTKIVIQTPVS